MNVKKSILYLALACLVGSSFSSPLMAMDGAPEALPAANQLSQAATKGGNWLYTETLGKRPGYTLCAVVGLFGAHVAYQQYKAWHNARARIRRQLWEKIQQECYDFTVHGTSKRAKVRNIADPNIATALLNQKNDWLKDANNIYNWGIIRDSRLVRLVNEFFDVLKNKSANVPTPAPASQKTWWQFWKTQKGERLLSDILNDIEECLMGSCG